jgi:C_GCAxxG_C_C family probable redox protein
MNKKSVEERTNGYFKSGHYCSEAVLKSITGVYDKAFDPDLVRAGSGFGGGFGSSHKEACGALTGGIIALGLLYGRTKPTQDPSFLKELVNTYRDRFEREFGSTNCGGLLESLGEQDDNFNKCGELTTRAAGILAEIIEDCK